MPFLPFVVLLAWQAVSKSASFVLGWATALYFGQVPGRQGRILSVISLLAAAWVVVLVGYALPIAASSLLVGAGVLSRGFDVEPLHAVGLAAGIVLVPPGIAAATVYGEFGEERSLRSWLRRMPVSFPASFMLGLSVLQMVAITPVLLAQRWRARRTLVQVPLVMGEGTTDDDLVDAVRDALRSADIEDVSVSEARGPKTWPMRTIGFAARHLLGSVVRGRPMELEADGIEIYVYATNISILGPKEDAHRVRAAVTRELAFSNAYLTWSDEGQGFEDALREAYESAAGEGKDLRGRLDELQVKIDSASLNSEEWNVLYRLRLQVEQRAADRRR